MIYYLIFAIATSAVAMLRYQAPAVFEWDLPIKYNLIFWSLVFLFNFMLAPILAVVLLFSADRFMEAVDEACRKIKNKS